MDRKSEMCQDSIFQGNSLDLLIHFELILESDPRIDELGFIHPTQFISLPGEESEPLKDGNFWNRNHKLGVSTHVVVPLYRAAKDAFFGAFRHYRTADVSGEDDFSWLEIEVMKHSKALLLLSCDFGTAWNSRKLIVSKKQNMSMFIDELLLSALILSYSHKSEQAWCHRRWVIKMIAGKCSYLQEIIMKESELVEKIAERSKMNYRAWNHRCWLVSYMTREQALYELKNSRNWAGLHVADNSCFHYRTRLILKILGDSCYNVEEESSGSSTESCQIFQEELEWNEVLIRRYIGREALWLYRRFLFICWIEKITNEHKETTYHNDCKSCANVNINKFLENELCLLDSCMNIPDEEFEDFQAQAVHSSTYILWLAKQIPESKRNELQLKEKLSMRDPLTTLSLTFPERSSLWSNLLS